MANEKVKQAVDQLNKLFELSPEAVTKLIDHRVPVTKELTEFNGESLSRLTLLEEEGAGACVLGSVGLLNMVLREHDMDDYVCARYDDADVLIGFSVLPASLR